MGDHLPKHHALDDLEWVDLGATGWARASVTLEAGDTAFAPGKTDDLIYGPCIVTYERAPSRSITALVERQD